MLRGVRRFNELQRSVPGISRSVLVQRLQRLERTGVTVRRAATNEPRTEYRLTEMGRELGSVIHALNDWAARWIVPNGPPGDVDPDGLMLWIRRHVVLDELPPRRIVIGFELHGSGPARRYWLVLTAPEVSLCPEYPGFQEDLWVSAEVAALYRVFAGSMLLADAVDGGLVRIDGPPSLARAVPSWFRLQ